MAVTVVLVPVMMVDALVMEMTEGAPFIDRNVGIALHDIDLIVLVFCHFRVIRVVMALFRDLFAAASAASVCMGVALVVMVLPAGASVLVGVAFVVVVMAAGAFGLMGVAFVAMVMPAGAVVIFFIFLVVCMRFGAMDGFLCLMAVAASAVMYMLFIVFFHGMSPYLEWKRCFLTGIILWCYFSILQRHRKWSMRNTLIFQVGGQG